MTHSFIPMMWCREGFLQFRTPAKTDAMLTSSSHWKNKRQISWFEIKTTYWKQQWDKKGTVTIPILITKVYKKREWCTWKNAHAGPHNNKNIPDISPHHIFSSGRKPFYLQEGETPFVSNNIRYLDIAKKLSWPKPGQPL